MLQEDQFVLVEMH